MNIQLPSPYNRLASDSVAIQGRGIHTLSYGGSGGYINGSLYLTPIAKAGIATLNSLLTTLGGLSGSYEKFIVPTLTVRVVPTIPMTVGAVIAVGYEPSFDCEQGNPGSLADVMVSKHHALANQQAARQFSLQPMMYRGDWCMIDPTCSQRPDQDNGYLQWFSNYVGDGTAGVVGGYLDISFTIVFAGLHRTGG